MSYQAPTLRELSRHEAGHAYAFAAVAHLEEPDELGLSSGAGGHRGWCRRKTLLFEQDSLDGFPDRIRSVLEQQGRLEIIVALAGPLAEGRFRHGSSRSALRFYQDNLPDLMDGASPYQDGDLALVRRVLASLRPTEPLAVIAELLCRASEIVDANWHAIGSLANALLKKQTLDRSFLEDWFEARPAKACDPSTGRTAMNQNQDR